MHLLYTHIQMWADRRGQLSAWPVYIYWSLDACVPGIPNDTFLVPVLVVIVPVLAVMPSKDSLRTTQRTPPYSKYCAVVILLFAVNLVSHSVLLSRHTLCGHLFPGNYRHVSSHRRVHTVVKMGGVVKTLRRSNSLSRSVFSTVRSFGYFGFGKGGLLEKGSFQKSPFSRDSRVVSRHFPYRPPKPQKNSKTQKSYSKVTFGLPAKVTQKLF